MSCVQGLSQDFQEAASNIYEGVSAADMFNCKRFLLRLFNNRIHQVGTTLAVMAGDTVSCSGRFGADETAIIQERSHTQTASWQPCLQFGSSQRRICLCLLERGCVDCGTVSVSCSWLVLHSRQSQSLSSSSPSQRPRGSGNWRAIKEALKRSNCQHGCLRFFRQWRNGCTVLGAMRTQWRAFLEIHLTVCPRAASNQR